MKQKIWFDRDDCQSRDCFQTGDLIGRFLVGLNSSTNSNKLQQTRISMRLVWDACPISEVFLAKLLWNIIEACVEVCCSCVKRPLFICVISLQSYSRLRSIIKNTFISRLIINQILLKEKLLKDSKSAIHKKLFNKDT